MVLRQPRGHSRGVEQRLVTATPGHPRERAIADRTQSCDLIHGSYEHEPAVEAYVCESLPIGEKPDGNLTAGKNPRTLIVPFAVSTDNRWFQICSSGRTLFPRQLLASLVPDDSVSVSDDAVAILQRWLVNRVIRTAFPDAFNDRTKKARQKLEKLLKKGGEPLLGLYINLTPWEEVPEHRGLSRRSD